MLKDPFACMYMYVRTYVTGFDKSQLRHTKCQHTFFTTTHSYVCQLTNSSCQKFFLGGINLAVLQLHVNFL